MAGLSLTQKKPRAGRHTKKKARRAARQNSSPATVRGPAATAPSAPRPWLRPGGRSCRAPGTAPPHAWEKTPGRAFRGQQSFQGQATRRLATMVGGSTCAESLALPTFPCVPFICQNQNADSTFAGGESESTRGFEPQFLLKPTEQERGRAYRGDLVPSRWLVSLVITHLGDF